MYPAGAVNGRERLLALGFCEFCLEGRYMKGLVYRFGVRVKDYGERFGSLPIIGGLFIPLIKAGLLVKDMALTRMKCSDL